MTLAPGPTSAVDAFRSSCLGGHRALDGLDVGLGRALGPRRVRFEHRRDGVTVLLRDPQRAFTNHEIPANGRVPGTVRFAVADCPACLRVGVAREARAGASTRVGHAGRVPGRRASPVFVESLSIPATRALLIDSVLLTGSKSVTRSAICSDGRRPAFETQTRIAFFRVIAVAKLERAPQHADGIVVRLLTPIRVVCDFHEC